MAHNVFELDTFYLDHLKAEHKGAKSRPTFRTHEGDAVLVKQLWEFGVF